MLNGILRLSIALSITDFKSRLTWFNVFSLIERSATGLSESLKKSVAFIPRDFASFSRVSAPGQLSQVSMSEIVYFDTRKALQDDPALFSLTV